MTRSDGGESTGPARPTRRSFDRAERARIIEALHRGEAPACPACGGPLLRHDVTSPRSVSYVRRRVLLLCPSCRRSGAFDIEEGGGRARP